MKLIVDANIVFSGILYSNGKIGDLLINSNNHFEFIAPEFLRTELHKLYPKLSKISKMTIDDVRESEFQVCKEITFISEEIIKQSIWLAAEKLVADIDPKDAHYIAYSKHFRCKILSGDKALINGLAQKGFKNFITTEELYNLRQNFSSI
jgi:predicted nucleic acid-binding protein